MKGTAVIAYLIDMVATFMAQVAYLLMKKGMIEVENSGLNGGKKKIPFFTCKWLTGFLCLAIGSLVHVACLPFCDLVVLSTNSSVGIVFNSILSVIYLGETVVWRYDLVAYTLIIGGSLMIVLLSSYEEQEYTPDDIKALLWSDTTLVFFLIFVVFTVLTIIQYFWHTRELKKFNALANQWLR